MTDAIHPTTVPTHFGPHDELDLLCRLIRQEKVILWVGSGFSSYAGYPTGSELISLILADLGDVSSVTALPRSTSLNEVADIYTAVKGRNDLIALLKEHYGKTPQRFDIHESLSLINRVKYIITTNYDSLFEHAFGYGIVKIAHDDELPGSTDYPERAVLLKIHGDLSDPDSIVITSEDYDKFDKDSIIWSKIKSLLAEYSVVFIGYSIRDPNVKEMLTDIHGRLKGRKHQYFFIERKIDEEKRADLHEFDLHFIEMEADSAVDYMIVNAIQYSFLDGMKNPALLSRSDPLFESRGFHVDRSFTGGKIAHASLVPMRPDIHCEFKLTLSSKTGNNTQILAFHKFATGQSFEPVTLTDSECNISIPHGEMNGIFIFDPSIQSYSALSVSSQPGEIVPVDLQLQNASFRLSNMRMKIFKSDVLLKFEIEDPDFNLELTIPNESNNGKLNFSLHNIPSDIERGRDIYNLFDSWIRGETLELLTDRLPINLLIPPPEAPDFSPNSPPIHALSQLYTDLSEIQRILKVRLPLPDEITMEHQRTIREIVTFLRGRKQKIPEIKATLLLKTNDLTPLIKGESLTLGGAGPVGEMEFSLFSRLLKVPYRIEGLDIQFENVEKILELTEQGVKELPVVMKSKTDQLYILYQTPTVEFKQSARDVP